MVSIYINKKDFQNFIILLDFLIIPTAVDSSFVSVHGSGDHPEAV
jgi:hypothetical protein